MEAPYRSIRPLLTPIRNVCEGKNPAATDLASVEKSGRQPPTNMPGKAITALLLSIFSIFLIRECMSRFPLFSEQENGQNIPSGQSQVTDTSRVQKAGPDTVLSNPEVSKINKPEPTVRRPRHPVPAPAKTAPATPTLAPAPDSVQLQAQHQAEKDLLKATWKKDTASRNMGIPGNDGSNPFASGGGLSGRKLVSRVAPRDDSQAEGKVCVQICVNAQGDVISAAVTQRGSTTTDAGLRNKSLAAVQNWKFEPRPGLESQCGTVTFNFVLK